MNPFSYRIILLLGLMILVSIIDIVKNRTQAGKYREYAFIVICGILGAIVGCVNDLITSSISPDYFVLGKGLEDGPALRVQAGLFGLQVGFSAGVIGGAIALFASRRKSAHLPAKFTVLFRLLWIPVAGAIVGGILFPLAFSQCDPLHFSAQLDRVLTTGAIDRFRQVWWIHLGLYAGMAIGLVIMILRAVKQRPSTKIQPLAFSI